MNWNPYKRIAALEAMHTKNIAVLDTLADKLNRLSDIKNARSKWLTSLEDRLQEMNQRLNPYAAAPVRSEGAPVFAKQKAKAKQNEYQRAYRARKKAAAQAVGGTA